MSDALEELEIAACIPQPVHIDDFNVLAEMPYGCTIQHMYLAMNEFINFLGFINQQLYTKDIQRLENMLMPDDSSKGIELKPFRFIKVVGARLTKDDWTFSGRSETSRRTITATVRDSGYEKMMANWIYKAPASGK